ncbi:hypothetical protein EC991_000709 [Linnemannia zychae]|nr:hypothetical protein EC991_000709 [Linnemannia zychae]
MLRPIKSLTALLVGCLFLFTFLLISTTSSSTSLRYGSYTPRRPSSLRGSVPNLNNDKSCESGPIENNNNSNTSQKKQGRPVATKVTRQVRAAVTPVIAPAPTALIQTNHGTYSNINNNNSPVSTTYQEQDQDQERYLMYIPYAGVTNQLISIWHGSLIAKALNRTLLIPNLSPNVHVEPPAGEQQREPAPTKWSEFFDLDEYARSAGVKMEELDSFLERRGIVEQSSSSVPPAVGAAIRQFEEKLGNLKEERRKKRSMAAEPGNRVDDDNSDSSRKKKKRSLKKRWIHLESLVQQSNPIISKSSSAAGSAGSQEPVSTTPTPSSPSSTITINPKTTTKKTTTVIRQVHFPTVQKCFSEAGYGTDRRIDMTGRRFMQRYNIDPTLTPTPFIDPLRDNGSIWSRWRMDKVIERYQQPQYQQEEILCLGHVYRLLPGGHNRVWTEFGQYFQYTDRVQTFVDEILNELLPKEDNNDQYQELIQQEQGVPLKQNQVQPFVGLHLRRGDFYRHCLGITSPADPNGWNRCYPSTDHIVSLLDSTPSTTTTANNKKLPVLVLTNERDPQELAKADAQNWIRVDHARLGTLERFGRYGPILIDGALLARASLLVGVEYSTYFRTASKRAETWNRGQTLFVT